MARQAILTRDVLAGIPALIGDIAERLGCKESALAVRCSVAGISLRGPKRLELRGGAPLTLSRETIASSSARAVADGCSEAQLASDLLETIARDSLYDAVLDSAPAAASRLIQFSRPAQRLGLAIKAALGSKLKIRNDG